MPEQHDPRNVHPNQILDAIARNTQATADAVRTLRAVAVFTLIMWLVGGAIALVLIAAASS